MYPNNICFGPEVPTQGLLKGQGIYYVWVHGPLGWVVYPAIGPNLHLWLELGIQNPTA